MTLSNIRKGLLKAPLRILVYGVEGVGKSSFAKDAEAPIFLGKENGTEELDVHRLPEPSTWSEVFEATAFLQHNDTPYKTLVIDPVNFLEPLCWAKVCVDNGWSSIDQTGYGKGYDAALDEWRRFVVALDRLREVRSMNIVLVAHAQVKGFNDPESGESYDRYQLAMNAKAAGLLKQWASAVLFAKHEVATQRDAKTKRVHARSNGTRTLYTEWSAAYDAKNRYNLPASLPLSWEDFIAAVNAGRGGDANGLKERADAHRCRIEELLAEFGDEAYAAKARGFVKAAGNDLGRLAEIENRVAARVAAKPQAETPAA